jgi:hypothetical protein
MAWLAAEEENGTRRRWKTIALGTKFRVKR